MEKIIEEIIIHGGGGYQKLEKIDREIKKIKEQRKGEKINQEYEDTLNDLEKLAYKIKYCLSEDED